MKLAKIKKAFDALSGVFYSANKNWAEALLAQCKAEEKSHRSFRDDFAKYHPDAPSVADIGKLFAVKRVAEYLTGEKLPQGKEYLHAQTSCFIAAGIVDEYGTELLKAFESSFCLPDLAALCYTDFVKVKNVA